MARTIEEMCRLLDERDIDYKLRKASGTSARETVYWEYEKDGDWACAEYAVTIPLEGYGHLSADQLTPEQVIVATLGGWTCENTSGTLTAEQVREAVYRNSTYNDIYEVYQVSRTDMQAIADELNAAISGECECDVVKIYGKLEAWNTRAYTTDELTFSGTNAYGLPVEDVRVFGMTLDEVRQMMKRDAELEAKVDELLEKIDNFDGETYCGGTIVDWYEMTVRLQAQMDEMNETHMKLPVDADGVPIRPGDRLKSTFAELPEPFTAYFIGRGGEVLNYETSFHFAEMTRHVESDIVAEELAKFLTACGDDDPHHYDEQIVEFAERIRKVVHDGD